MAETVLDKFLRYVVIDTQSKEDSESYPSTAKQFDLLNLLVKELKDLGVPKVSIDEYGYVMAAIPANVQKNVPAIGFIAHVDTSPEVSGANVKPQIITNYKGGDIIFAPVQSMSDLAADPQVIANNYIIDYNHETLGPVKVLGLPIALSETPGEVIAEAPEFGQHTEEVLQELGNYTWEEISELREKGAI